MAGGCGGRKRGDTADVDDKRNIYVAKSFRLSVIDWLHVARLYIPYILTASLVFAVSCLLPPADAVKYTDTAYVVASARAALDSVSSLWYAYAIIAACLHYAITAKPSVYLMDFAVYEPPKEWRLTKAQIVDLLRAHGCYTEASVEFMGKLLANSGTGEMTHWPPGTVNLLREAQALAAAQAKAAALAAAGEPSTEPLPPACVPDRSISAARAVAEAVLVGCMGDLLKRTGVKARDIDFLIVNCSLFCPTPSLCSIVARRFGLRPTVRTYNLGGMGCSAGVVSIDLAKQLLQNRANSTAVVISTEEITQQMYLGNDRSMLVQNTLFRVGGAAILLSNKPMDGFRAKYKLLHTVRVQDMSDAAHEAVYQCEDAAGERGIRLSKEITSVAGRALKDNLTILGPQVLPLREQVAVIASIAKRKAADVLNRLAEANGFRLPGTATGRIERPPIYVPDFKRAINHFCIHAGGRAVIDGIEQNLKLERYHTAPSRATLYHWGNTSSSSIWYELRYCEGENDKDNAGKAASVSGSDGSPVAPKAASASAASSTAAAAPPGDVGAANGWDSARKWFLPDYAGRHVRPGERVLQLAFGSGFKCNSAVWLRMR